MADTPPTAATRPDPTRGSRLRALRKALGLTQKQLAEASGLPREYVNKIECGWNQARGLSTIVALARGLKMNVQDLLRVLDGVLAPGVVVAEQGKQGGPEDASPAAARKGSKRAVPVRAAGSP